jgi:hypothetical protein
MKSTHYFHQREVSFALTAGGPSQRRTWESGEVSQWIVTTLRRNVGG